MPAAAVIPAPIAYINVVAVKKLVVEFLAPFADVRESVMSRRSHPCGEAMPFTGLWPTRILYCEKIRVFKAGLWLEYISME